MEQLQASLRGTIILPDHPSYDQARRVWNGMIDRRPAAVVRAAGVADVVRTVAYARDHNVPLAIRGGGHNVSGNATCDNGIVLDLSAMKSVRVDLANRAVRAEAGVVWRELDHEAEVFGLATPGGVISTTGIAGLTLGGGFGCLSRRFGMVCDNLLSVDLVTADGQLLTASANQNAELFWGLRGAGANFGVATSFKYRLHPVAGIYGGLMLFPFDRAKAVLERYREVTAAAPDELTLFAGLLPTPDGGKVAGIVAAFLGPEQEGKRALAPIRDLQPMLDTVTFVPYTRQQQLLDANYPPGLRNYWKSSYLNSLPDEAIDLFIESAANAPALSHLLIEQFGGASARVPVDATAFEHRSAPYNLLILGLGTEPSQDEANMRWARNLWNAAQRFSTGGTYVNYLGTGENVAASYNPHHMQRLIALKTQYDPRNLFRLNQNIRPAA